MSIWHQIKSLGSGRNEGEMARKKFCPGSRKNGMMVRRRVTTTKTVSAQYWLTCWCGLLPVEQVGTHDSFCGAKIHTGAPEKGTYGNWKRNPKQPPECQRSGKGPADPFTSHNNRRLWPPQTREGADQRCRRKPGFFSAGPGKPAHLAGC